MKCPKNVITGDTCHVTPFSILEGYKQNKVKLNMSEKIKMNEDIWNKRQ